MKSKRDRQRQRQKIDNLTPHLLSNNLNYHNSTTSPHKVLRHQYQHLRYHSYSDIEHLTDRKMYPLSHVFAYEPLKSNQIQEERGRTKSIGEGGEFLREYDSVRFQKGKEMFMREWEQKQREKEEEMKKVRGRRKESQEEEEEQDSSMTSSLVSSFKR